MTSRTWRPTHRWCSTTPPCRWRRQLPVHRHRRRPDAFEFNLVDNGRGVVQRPQEKLDPIADYQVVLQGIDANGEGVGLPDGALNFTTRAALEGPADLQKKARTLVASINPTTKPVQNHGLLAFRLRTSHPVDEQTVVYGDRVLTRTAIGTGGAARRQRPRRGPGGRHDPRR